MRSTTLRVSGDWAIRSPPAFASSIPNALQLSGESFPCACWLFGWSIFAFRKAERNSLGLSPVCLRKKRLKYAASSKPRSRAICWMSSAVYASCRCASRTTRSLMIAVGDSPRPSRQARPSVTGVIPSASAYRPSGQCCLKCASTNSRNCLSSWERLPLAGRGIGTGCSSRTTCTSNASNNACPAATLPLSWLCASAWISWIRGQIGSSPFASHGSGTTAGRCIKASKSLDRIRAIDSSGRCAAVMTGPSVSGL